MPSQAMKRPALQRNKPMDDSRATRKSLRPKTKTKKPSKTKQGYNAKLDESLGMRRGKESTKKQSMTSRRDESKGMAKKVGKKRAYGAVKSMDKRY